MPGDTPERRDALLRPVKAWRVILSGYEHDPGIYYADTAGKARQRCRKAAWEATGRWFAFCAFVARRSRDHDIPEAAARAVKGEAE